MDHAEIIVEGMHCSGCVTSVEKALARLDGVSEARADLDAGRATVAFDPSVVGVESLREAIEDAGFDARL